MIDKKMKIAMKLRKTAEKLCDWWTLERVRNLLIVVMAVSLIPILYCSFFDYATGDDLGYSAGVHHLLMQHASLSAILKEMFDNIKQSYYSYQGTWSSIFLFQLQPG